MPNRSAITRSPPAAVAQALTRLGRNLRTARLRRQLRLQDVADRLGVSRLTIADLEKGKPSASAAAYLGALWSLGLLSQADNLGDPDRDEEGRILESVRRPQQARRRRRRLDNDF
ncbi:MAG: helix-turn-helix domain-containing protein [Gemmatimonadetes bacterium]|nr:helix-turn-helix domain-containing protein [Gemmatimonadota bacterium]